MRFASLLAALLFAAPAWAQTTIYQQSFEDDDPAYTTSATCNDGFTDFFTRTDTTDVSDDYQISDFDGDFIFAAQDIDAEDGDPPENGLCDTVPQRVSFDNIDISGFNSLSFAGLFAEDDSNDGNEDWDEADLVHIKYRIDSDDDADLQNLIWFENDGSQFNSAAFQDTNFDGTGDGTELTAMLSEFTANIMGTGSTLDIVILFSLDSGDEDIAIDNIRITGTPDLPPGTQLFCSATPVDFPASGTTSGPTAPYPTDITVSGVMGTVTDVDVYVRGLSHMRPRDMDVFVEGPDGSTVWLFSDQGGETAATNVDLAFDDEAPSGAPIPFSGPLVSGTYIPANVGTFDSFDPPAPALPTSVSLSDFDGANPNGTWNLWGDDGAADNVGEFDEWCVALTVDDAPPVNTDPTSDTVMDGDSFDVEVGETYMATYSFSDADEGDNVSVAVSGAPANFIAQATDGNPATVGVDFTPDASQAGMSFDVTFTATDGNGGSTAVTITYNVGEEDPEPTDCDYTFTAIALNDDVSSDGGQAQFFFEIDNSDNAMDATVDIFAAVEDDMENTLFTRAPRTITVPAGAVFRARYNQRVPASVPDGSYTFKLFAGDYNDEDPSTSEVCGTETFTITKGDEEDLTAGKAGSSAPLVVSDWDQNEITGVEITESALAVTGDEIRVGPNPTRGATTFAFALAEDGDVSLALYDVQGREVATVVDGPMRAGSHTASLSETLAPGVYVWQLRAGDRVESGRLTVVR